MSRFKKILALFTAAVTMLSLAACRSADDTAYVFTSGKSEYAIPAAVYISYMIEADSAFQSEVNNAQIEQYSTTASNIDYNKETIKDENGKSKEYLEYVKETAKEDCAEHAYIEMEFDKLGLSLSKDSKSNFDYYVEYYWQNAGTYYETNGVSRNSFEKFFKNGYKRQALFDYYYAKGGVKEIAEKDVKAALEDNYVLADTIVISFTDDEGNQMTDKEKKKAKEKLEGYLENLKNGTMTFAEAYEDNTPNTTPSQTETDDPYAVMYGSEETQGASDYYAKLNKMKKGVHNGKVLEFGDCYMLAVRTDILSDKFYLETYDSEMRSILKNEEFTDFVTKEANKLEYTTDKGVVNYYIPKRLQEPTT
jgi:hypothetical protein